MLIGKVVRMNEYSFVEGRQGSSSRYCLRLGFFNGEQFATTIISYVKTFFRAPSVVRVSAAERARFDPVGQAEHPSKMPSPSSSKVVELRNCLRKLARSNFRRVDGNKHAA